MTCPRKQSALEINQVEDGFVAIDRPNERMHFLNGTAFFVYSLCDGTNTVEDIVRLAGTAYGLDASPGDEVDSALAMLEKEGLISR